MTRRISFPFLIFALSVSCFGGPAAALPAAEPQSLRSTRKAGEVSHVEVLLEVGGDLSLVEEGKVRKLPMSVVGTMIYGEKFLGENLLQPGEERTSGPLSIRYYDRADAVIKIEKGLVKPQLRADRRLIAVAPAQSAPPQSATTKDTTVKNEVGSVATTMFSPSGPLAREELDLIDVPANSALIEGLLPKDPVAQGDRWQHGDQLLAGLLGLDAVNRAEVSSQLVEINDATAQVEIRGNVQGASGGVASEMEVKGRYRFDRKLGRITWLALLTKEKRSIGHVAPGVDVVARLQMKIAPDGVYTQLDNQALAGMDLSLPPERALLEYESTAGHFRLLHDRQWHVMNETADSLAMRLVDRGELVAQCNVTSLEPVKPGGHASLDKFQQDVEKSLSKSFRRFLGVSESVNDLGYTIYRVAAEGTVDELPIQWNYYLVADAKGRQTVFAFTLESNLVERLGAADAAVVGTLEFTDAPAAGNSAESATAKSANVKGSGSAKNTAAKSATVLTPASARK